MENLSIKQNLLLNNSKSAPNSLFSLPNHLGKLTADGEEKTFEGEKKDDFQNLLSMMNVSLPLGTSPQVEKGPEVAQDLLPNKEEPDIQIFFPNQKEIKAEKGSSIKKADRSFFVNNLFREIESKKVGEEKKVEEKSFFVDHKKMMGPGPEVFKKLEKAPPALHLSFTSLKNGSEEKAVQPPILKEIKNKLELVKDEQVNPSLKMDQVGPIKEVEGRFPASIMEQVHSVKSKESPIESPVTKFLPQDNQTIKQPMLIGDSSFQDIKKNLSTLNHSNQEINSSVIIPPSLQRYQQQQLKEGEGIFTRSYKQPTNTIESMEGGQKERIKLDDLALEMDSQLSGEEVVGSRGVSRQSASISDMTPLFKLDQIGSVPKEQLLQEIKNHLIQLSTAQDKNVGVIFEHQDLGRVLLQVKRSPDEKVHVHIQTGNNEALAFFQKHREEMISIVKESAPKMGEFIIDRPLGDMGQSLFSAGKSESGQWGERNQSSYHHQGYNQSEQEGNAQRERQQKRELYNYYAGNKE